MKKCWKYIEKSVFRKCMQICVNLRHATYPWLPLRKQLYSWTKTSSIKDSHQITQSLISRIKPQKESNGAFKHYSGYGFWYESTIGGDINTCHSFANYNYLYSKLTTIKLKLICQLIISIAYNSIPYFGMCDFTNLNLLKCKCAWSHSAWKTIPDHFSSAYRHNEPCS